MSPEGYPPGVYNVKKFNARQKRYFRIDRKFVTAEDLFSNGLQLNLNKPYLKHNEPVCGEGTKEYKNG